ncbi:MAG: hypothetical protein LBF61_01145, partial [Azoarcus sp.]|nr:hypothetical protein [Azoarcus sp.]
TAAYTCPESIKTAKGEFGLSGYNVTLAYQPTAFLRAEPVKYVLFNFGRPESLDVICEYKGFGNAFILRISGVRACGRNDKPSSPFVCWTTDPYAGKK